MISVADRIRRIEEGLVPRPALPLRNQRLRSVRERMDQLLVPGVSVAVINNGEIEWACGYGVLAYGRPDPVTPETMFQACSISKPVMAMGVLRLVDAGRLDLDEDVNCYLASWKVPPNGNWQPRITIRHLLSHTAGTTVSGFGGYAPRQSPPTLLEILNASGSSNTGAVRVDTFPGLQYRYSGGGSLILQQMLIDITGADFPALMKELVFDPLGMTHSTFEQPLPAHLHPFAARGHRAGGQLMEGGWNVHPEMAAAGLWTTPSDLARLSIAIQQIRAGKARAFLSKALVDEALTPQFGTICGLGFFIEGTGDLLRFYHSGSNEGFKTLSVAFAERGQGAVFMSNGDYGKMVWDDILASIILAYEWPISADYNFQGNLAPVRKEVAASLDMLRRYVGTYSLRGQTWAVEATEQGLFLQAPDQMPLPLRAESAEAFFALDLNISVRFVQDEAGAVTGMYLKQNDRELFATR